MEARACGGAQPLEQLEERETREKAGEETHLVRVRVRVSVRVRVRVRGRARETREEAGEETHLLHREREARVLVGEPDGQQACMG